MLDCSQSQTSQTEFICHSLQKYRRESCIANQNWRFVVGQLGLKLGFDWMNLEKCTISGHDNYFRNGALRLLLVVRVVCH